MLVIKLIRHLLTLPRPLKESQRLMPSVTKLFRRAAQDCRLSNGLEVKQGQAIAIPVYPLHHSSEYFPDPFEFRPDRFKNMDNEIKQYAFLPFSAGPMNCLGKFDYQQSEMDLLLFFPTDSSFSTSVQE